MSKENAAGDWVRCHGCAEMVYRKRLVRNLMVCPGCGHHHRITARERIAQLVDDESFVELDVVVDGGDPLGFTDTVPYPRRIAAARRATGEFEAVVCGTAAIEGHRLVLAVMDFRFLGGSLGVAVGELLTAAGELALAERLPLLLVTASGGARMQEGCLSLLQMAKVAQIIGRLHEAGLLTATLVTDPTYGGVAASFATQTDVIIAEPGARLGFAGPRVIAQTIRQELPAGFQTAEFLLRHGMVDRVDERGQLRTSLGRLMAWATAATPATATAGAATPAPTRPAPPPDATDLDPWAAVQLARHRDRPTTRDYVHLLADWFVELHGDRTYADSPALVGGAALLGGRPVLILGTQKGHTTQELLATNFGMVGPEGYRKAQRLLRLAEKLGVPVLTLVDTPGAYPGADAEERGQAQAIADSILQLTGLRVPVVAVVTGEGGSGGALALAVADRVFMFAHGIYSVISPEGCAAILWNSPDAAPAAASALRLTAPELHRLGAVDDIVPEPRGGAHTDPVAAAENLRDAVLPVLAHLSAQPAELRLEARRQKLRRYGTSGVVPALPQRRENAEVSR